jgi:UDP-N-acetylglucosamine acyltransferase
MATLIHPTAIVETGAELGADCEIMAHAIVTRHCVLGDGVVVHPFAVIGGDPQYLKFDRRMDSFVRVGAGTVFREHVTVNRSIQEHQATTIGAGCFFMATSHAAHDCAVGDHVVLANAALLAGHVSVGAHTFFGGASAVHQFCRIGTSVMVAGHAAITRDVPPYVMVAERDDVIGFNLVGLKRRGFGRETMAELKQVFHAIYETPGNIRAVAETLLGQNRGTTPEARGFLEFFAGGKRSFVRPRRKAKGGNSDAD